MSHRILTIEQIKLLENGHYVWIYPRNPDSMLFARLFVKDEDGLLHISELFRKRELEAEYISPMSGSFWTWEELKKVSDTVQFLDDKETIEDE